MANIKSAEKRIRSSARKEARNRNAKSRLRHVLKTQRESGTRESFPKSVSEVDRALAKGVIKKNAAARYKSRLAKALAKKS
jgi:small subunit ribosomal protein S20